MKRLLCSKIIRQLQQDLLEMMTETQGFTGKTNNNHSKTEYS